MSPLKSNKFQTFKIYYFVEKSWFALQLFTYLAKPSTSKVVTSWWVLTQDVQNIFKYIFWIVNHLDMKLDRLISIVTGNIFWQNLVLFKGLGLKSRSFLIYHPTPINRKLIMTNLLFLLFLRVSTEMIKNYKNHRLKSAGQIMLPNYQSHEKAWKYFLITTTGVKTSQNVLS